MLFKKMRIDLNIGNFKKLNGSLQPRRLHEVVIGVVVDVVVAAATWAVSNISLIISIASIGWTIYNAVASKGKAQQGGVPNALDSNGQLVNTRQSSDPIRVLYGIIKTGGVWCYTKFSSTTNDIINIVVTWGEGEISGLGTAIDSSLIYSGSTLDDLEARGEFVYAGCSCDMACDGYVPCSCNMACHVDA